MKQERYTVPSAVYLLFLRDNQLLLQKRANTGYKDGEYGLPSGHKEANESIIDAAIREAMEEVGITIAPENLQLAHSSNRKSTDREYLDFYFWVESWEGEICNAEPHKCAELTWQSIENLPENTIDYIGEVLTHIKVGQPLSIIGW